MRRTGAVCEFVTVTSHLALASPAVAVIVTEPSATAVTVPSATVATLAFEVDQTISASVFSLVAVSTSVS